MTRKQAQTRKKRKNDSDKTFWKLLAVGLLVAAVIVGILSASRNFAEGKGFLGFENSSVPRLEVSDAELMKVAVPGGTAEQLVDYTGFSVSFNPSLRIPNYVVYELTRTETEGGEERARHFLRDGDVKNCPEPSDYARSGYDRGHMAPAADMKWSKQAMRESFYMTNVCPQRHALNGGAWKQLEEKVRDWAARDSSLIVISGPITDKDMQRLQSGVAVPSGFFKVLLAPYANPARGIAFIYKNEGGQKKISSQAVSIDSVESVTGFDFFFELPDETEERIEKSCNYNEWNS